MRILITGANGLLGRRLIDLSIKKGWQVYGIVHKAGEEKEQLWQKINLNLKEQWADESLPKKIDVIVHLAQSNYFRDFPNHADDLFGVNIASTFRLLQYARSAGANQFIYASTGGIYTPSSEQLREDSPIQKFENLGPYFGSKLCSEVIVQNYAPFLNTTILRPFFIYGPGQKRNAHLPRIFDFIKNNRPIQLQGRFGISINPVHVVDAAKAVIASVRNNFVSVVNIAGPEVLNMSQIAEGFAKYLQKENQFCKISEKNCNLVADISLMSEKLHKPTIRLLDSIFDVAF